MLSKGQNLSLPILGVALCFLAGCGQRMVTIEEKILPARNPTAYEFDATVAQVQSAVKKVFEHDRRVLFFMKDEGIVGAPDIFEKSENENDVVLREAFPWGTSKVYFRDGQALQCFLSFHLHITTVDQAKTRVEVITYDSRAITGLLDRFGAHGPASINVNVAPTTIEQYEILLELGKQLGAKGMPELILPKADAPTRKVTIERAR